jgi:hypothetical protein
MSSRRTLVFALGLGLLAACDRGAPPPHEHEAAGETAHAAVYQCPMHPQIIRHEPGTCPICGMALQRVDDAAAGGPTVPGHAGFVLTPERQQAIGVTRAPVERRTLTREIGRRGGERPALYAALTEYAKPCALGRGPRRGRPRSGRRRDGLVRAAALKLLHGHRHAGRRRWRSDRRRSCCPGHAPGCTPDLRGGRAPHHARMLLTVEVP